MEFSVFLFEQILWRFTWWIKAKVAEAPRPQARLAENPSRFLFVHKELWIIVLQWWHLSNVYCHPGIHLTVCWGIERDFGARGEGECDNKLSLTVLSMPSRNPGNFLHPGCFNPFLYQSTFFYRTLSFTSELHQSHYGRLFFIKSLALLKLTSAKETSELMPTWFPSQSHLVIFLELCKIILPGINPSCGSNMPTMISWQYQQVYPPTRWFVVFILLSSRLLRMNLTLICGWVLICPEKGI